MRFATAGALGFGLAGIAIADVCSRSRSDPVPAGNDDGAARLDPVPARRVRRSAPRPLALAGRPLGPARDRARARGSWASPGRRSPWRSSGPARPSCPGASSSALGVVAAFVVVGSAAALLAGALVPWSGEGVGDQLTTFAALAAITIAGSLVVGLVAPRLVSFGLPDAVVAVVVCGASVGRRAPRSRPPARGRRPMIADADTLSLAPGVVVRARAAGRRGTRRCMAAQPERRLRPRPHGPSRRPDRPRARRRVLASRPRPPARTCSASLAPERSALVNVERGGSRASAARRLARAGGPARSRRCGTRRRRAQARDRHAQRPAGGRQQSRGDPAPRCRRRGRRRGGRRPALGARRLSGARRSACARARNRRRARPPRGGARRVAARSSECARRARPPNLRPPRGGQSVTAIHRRPGRPADGCRARRRARPRRDGRRRTDPHDRRLLRWPPTAMALTVVGGDGRIACGL